MLQTPGGVLEATLQVMPRPAMTGSGSVRVTWVSACAPLLVTAIEKPIWLPAVTDGASAVLTMVRSGFGVTTVVVWQSASWLGPGRQFDFVTTMTLGSVVWPAGQPVSLSL